MARLMKKIKYIIDSQARKASYKKRKAGILKKIEELSTLCGVDACIIIYSEIDNQVPQVWPPSPQGVERVIERFRAYPRAEQCRKMVNLETFMEERVQKAKEQLERLRRENRDKEMTLLMYQYLASGKILDNNLTLADLNDLSRLIDLKLIEINYRLGALDTNLASTS